MEKKKKSQPAAAAAAATTTAGGKAAGGGVAAAAVAPAPKVDQVAAETYEPAGDGLHYFKKFPECAIPPPPPPHRPHNAGAPIW